MTDTPFDRRSFMKAFAGAIGLSAAAGKVRANSDLETWQEGLKRVRPDLIDPDQFQERFVDNLTEAIDHLRLPDGEPLFGETITYDERGQEQIRKLLELVVLRHQSSVRLTPKPFRSSEYEYTGSYRPHPERQLVDATVTIPDWDEQSMDARAWRRFEDITIECEHVTGETFDIDLAVTI